MVSVEVILCCNSMKYEAAVFHSLIVVIRHRRTDEQTDERTPYRYINRQILRSRRCISIVL